MSDADDRKQTTSRRVRGAPSSSARAGGEDDSAARESQDRSGAHSSEGWVGQRTCMPCHGAGKVISNLGGHARKVTCPWCRGGGERLTGVDAQEWRVEQQSALKSR